MRDIKFRAWDNNEEWMVDDMLLSFNGEILTDDVQPHDTPYKEIELADEGRYELMQYTGLKDKKGAEIYEGDIIRGIDRLPERTGGRVEDREVIGQVVIDNSSIWGFAIVMSEADYHLYNFLQNEQETEVIGNIHENPELLED